MEKIENKREVVNTVIDTIYRAYDGTEFNDESECKLYEESAIGVLFAKIAHKMIKEGDNYDLFGGSDDVISRVYKIDDIEEMQIIMHLYSIYSNKFVEKYLSDLNEYVGHCVCVNYRMYQNGFDCFWVTDVNKMFEEICGGQFKIVKNGKK